MMNRLRNRPVWMAVAVAAVIVSTVAWAQRYRGRSGRPGDWGPRRGVPNWETDQEFPTDVFTFVRIQYGSRSRYGRRGWGGGSWATDYPDSDLNFSYRLQELTSMKVHPEGKVIRLSDDELYDYPFIYFLEPGRLEFTDEEVEALRTYLLRGGFLMVDDFWGQREWENFYFQIKRVFPERSLVELPLNHKIFNCVYRLKEKPQVPSIGHALGGRPYGITWERQDARTPHFKAIFDDKDRMMVIICHNTDLGDGWEREGEDEWYFHEFAEKKAYPMGINIVFYAMTH